MLNSPSVSERIKLSVSQTFLVFGLAVRRTISQPSANQQRLIFRLEIRRTTNCDSSKSSLVYLECLAVYTNIHLQARMLEYRFLGLLYSWTEASDVKVSPGSIDWKRKIEFRYDLCSWRALNHQIAWYIPRIPERICYCDQPLTRQFAPGGQLRVLVDGLSCL